MAGALDDAPRARGPGEGGAMSERQVVGSGTIWGELVGSGDPEAQARYIIAKIGRALEAAGASLADVVRTRVYVTRAADWEAVGRAHARYFGATRPANTLVEVSALVGEGYLVEMD